MEITLEPAVECGGADEMDVAYVVDVVDFCESLVDVVKNVLKLCGNGHRPRILTLSSVEQGKNLQKRSRGLDIPILFAVQTLQSEKQSAESACRVAVKGKMRHF